MIKRIKIRDFKSIRELDLELDPVTVLVGRSGTGKSNIVQAIRFLRNVLVDEDKAIQFEKNWSYLVPAGQEEPTPSIEVFFNLPGEREVYRYYITYALKQHDKFSGHEQIALSGEKLMLGEEVIFARTRVRPRGNPGVWEWIKSPEIAIMPHQYDSPMLGRFPALQKVVLAYAALSSGIGYYNFPASALSQRNGTEHGTEFLQNLPGLSDNAATYLKIIAAITQNFQKPDVRKGLIASVQAINPSIVSIELDSVINPHRAVVGHEAGGKIFELSLEQESDGFRRFYAHLLALYQTPPKLTSVFEEPENAIFPGALSLLADEFKAAPKEDRGQVIITTHNPVFLDSFDVDCVRVVEMKDGKTIVGKVSKEQRDAVKDHLLTTGELLTTEQPKMEPISTAA